MLPFSDHTYIQAPFEDSDAETFDLMAQLLHEIDLTQVEETEDLTNLNDQVACAGGACLVDDFTAPSSGLTEKELIN